MKHKKMVAMLMGSILALTLLAGCGGDELSENVEKAKSNGTSSSQTADLPTESDNTSTADAETNSATAANSENTGAQEEQTSQNNNPAPDFSGSYTNTGNGTMMLSTAGGTSEGGNVPTVFASKNDMLIQIGVDTTGFDGSHLSYIYIDGMLNISEQLADSQITIDLSGDALKVGQHTVEVVQFDTDKQDGTVITYKSAAYEIKES